MLMQHRPEKDMLTKAQKDRESSEGGDEWGGSVHVL